MTTLADEIEALRLKMVETTEEEKHLVDTLGQRLKEADTEIMCALEQIVADQEHRRRDIAGLLSTIASRIGHVPRSSAARPPPLPAQRTTVNVAPVAHVTEDADVEAMAARLSQGLARQADRIVNPHYDDPDYVNGTHAH